MATSSFKPSKHMSTSFKTDADTFARASPSFAQHRTAPGDGSKQWWQPSRYQGAFNPTRITTTSPSKRASNSVRACASCLASPASVKNELVNNGRLIVYLTTMSLYPPSGGGGTPAIILKRCAAASEAFFTFRPVPAATSNFETQKSGFSMSHERTPSRHTSCKLCAQQWPSQASTRGTRSKYHDINTLFPGCASGNIYKTTARWSRHALFKDSMPNAGTVRSTAFHRDWAVTLGINFAGMITSSADPGSRPHRMWAICCMLCTTNPG